jgi:hypothetical protein
LADVDLALRTFLGGPAGSLAGDPNTNSPSGITTISGQFSQSRKVAPGFTASALIVAGAAKA